MMVVAVCALVLASCTGSSGDSSTTASSQATTATTTVSTTRLAGPTSTEPAISLPSDAVGDPAAIAAAREEALRGIRLSPESFPPGAVDIDIPWPDTTNPDPVAALRSIWEFDAWVASTLPYDRLAKLYLVEDSPAWSQAGEFIEQLDANQWIVEFDGPGFVWVSGEIVDESSPKDIPEQPQGSVLVVYRSEQSDVAIHRLVDTSLVTKGAGYSQSDRYAVLADTRTGWMVFWYGPAQ